LSSQFESKRSEIESIIKNKTRNGYILVVISVLSILSLFLYTYVVTDMSDIIGILYILSGILLMIGMELIDDPVNPYDFAFFEIVEALRLIEKPGKSEFLNLKARKKVIKAYKKLRFLRTAKKKIAPWHSIWHSTSTEIEKKFKKNLITRIAPALKNDTISPTYLIDIACALRGNHISLLENVNDALENQLEEKIEESEIISNFVSLILSSIITKAILIFIVALITVLGFLYVVTINVDLNFINVVKENPVQITAICVGTFVALFQVFKKKEKNLEN